MLLTVATLAITASLMQSNQQDDPSKRAGEPKSVPHESIPYDNWEGRRYMGGGITVTYRMYWAYVMSNTYPFDSTCILKCQGKKHLVHQQCDTSCDKICLSTHKKTFKPEFEFHTSITTGARAWHAGLTKELTAQGGNTSQVAHLANKAKSDATKEITDNIDKYTYKYSSGHFNKTPCSLQDRDFKYTVYSLFVSYSVYKDGKYVGGSLKLGGGPELLGTIKIPHKKFYEQKPVESCKCQFVHEKKRQIRVGGFIPLDGEPGGSTGNNMGPGPGSGTGGGTGLIRFAGLYIDPEGVSEYELYNPEIGSNVSVAYSLDSLNNFQITATNTSSMPVGLLLTPGSTFTPDDEKFQSMVNLDQLEFTVPSWSTREWTIPVSGPYQDPTTVKGFMACLNIGKKEPDGRASYSLGSTLDSRIIDMGYDMAQQRFRGPWNQAQIWTYMSGTSRKDINERLFPPVSRSRYLTGLYDLANTYHVDLSDDKYRDVFTHDLMLADGVLYKQIEWYVNEMSSRDARGLANWVKSNSGEFSYLFASDAQDWYMEHAANVVNALCFSDHPELQAAGLNVLGRYIPQGKRAELIEQGGLEGAVSLATGGGKNADPAMMVVTQYAPELAEDLKTAAEELPFPDKDPPK